MFFTKKDGAVAQELELGELFSEANRKFRNELFGSYLSKSFDLETVFTNTERNIKEIGYQLSNFQLLRDELKKQVEEKKAKELQEWIDKMSMDEAKAVLVKLQEKLG